MKHTNKTRVLGLSAALLAGTALGATVLSPVFTQNADARPIVVEAPKGAPISFAELVEKVAPAVVSVNVISEEEIKVPRLREDFFEFFRNRPGLDDYFDKDEEKEDDKDKPRTRESRSLGSGFFISENGYIVTNNHVVKNAKEIEVVLEDGRELEATIVGRDDRTDLAVLQVTEPGPYKYVEFETDTKPRRGDWVIALGNPFGYGGTATAGIVSSDGRELRGAGPYTDYLQIDAAINRGNSGGPTFDLYGRVIGVNTAIISPTGGSVGLGFAIKADQAKEIVDQLIKNGKVERGWLGVTIQSFSEEMAVALGLGEDRTGALVRQVVVDSPAQKSGIRVNDIILKIDGRVMEDSTEVTRTVGGMLAGSSHKFTIWRDGKEQVVNVKIGILPDDVNTLKYEDDKGSKINPDDVEGLADIEGMKLGPMSDTDRRRLGLEDGTGGVVIYSVEPGSPAARLGISKGDAILEVNLKPISSVAEFEAAVAAAKANDIKSILIEVKNRQQSSVLTLEFIK